MDFKTGQRVEIRLHAECLAHGGADEYPHGEEVIVDGSVEPRERVALVDVGHPFTAVYRENGKTIRRLATDDRNRMWVPEWVLVPVKVVAR